jgi:hypothetical protein
MIAMLSRCMIADTNTSNVRSSLAIALAATQTTLAMLACQPINKKPFRLADLAYTDVEYVEPHLLPCTVCHRTAHASYQAEMFKLEEKLPAIVKKIYGRVGEYVEKRNSFGTGGRAQRNQGSEGATPPPPRFAPTIPADPNRDL